MSETPPCLVYTSPVGRIAVYADNAHVTAVSLCYEGGNVTGDSDLSAAIEAQLQEYFAGGRRTFDLPFAAVGTPYQQRVWRYLSAIPFGELRSYGEAAEQLQSAARAVGGACRRNPIPLIVPCHRVVARNGLGGFSGHQAGAWLDVKHWLIQHEQAHRSIDLTEPVPLSHPGA